MSADNREVIEEDFSDLAEIVLLASHMVDEHGTSFDAAQSMTYGEMDDLHKVFHDA